MKLIRYIIAAPLLFAAYIALKCPCARIPSCHLDVFYKSIGLAVLFTAFENFVD